MQQIVKPFTDDEWAGAARPSDHASFGALETARGNLPLEAMDVRTAITGLSYRVRLRQTFVNNLEVPIEATYIFPLPDRGAVTAFRMRVAGREVEGEIQERGAARRAYDAAITAGHRAAIAEEERSGVFTMRAGNLVAGDRAVIELTLVGSLELEEGCGTFRFPLVVAPRYIPGKPLDGASVGDGVAADTDAVPDASRITPPVLLPGYPNPVRLALAVELDPAGLPFDNLRCALHSVITDRKSSGAVSVELRPGERLDRDFVLRFDLGGDDMATSLVASPDSDGEGGTFCLTALPPRAAAAARKPRDVVFVLDRSGSMAGWKMIAARRAVARMIDTLDATDRFAVLAFDNVIETPPALGAGLVAGSDRNRFRAVEFLAGLEARGGTEMLQPLVGAADLVAGGYRDRERVVVLATDGQVGNEDQILRQLAPRLEARVFTLGIDRAVNQGFLRRLAAIGAGSFSLVESEDRLDEVMDQLHRRIGEPLLTELSLAGEGFDIDPGSLVPRRLPDLFAATPLVIWGRYRGRARGRLVISGADGGGQVSRQALEPRVAESDAAAPIWARGRIRDLEDRYAIGDVDRQATAKSIVELSLRFKVLCRFTAFVAVDRAEVVNAGGERHHVTQPVEMPEGWGVEERAKEMAPAAAAFPMQAFGGAADDEASAAFDGLAAPAPMAPGAPPPRMMKSMAAPANRGQVDKKKGKRSRQAPARPAPTPAPKAAPSLGRRLLERVTKRDEPQPDWDAALARSVAARLREIVERHRRRGWLAAAARTARLVRELTELEADLRSLSAPAAILSRLTGLIAAVKALPEAEAGAAETLVTELLESIEKDAPSSGSAARRDQPFWR